MTCKQTYMLETSRNFQYLGGAGGGGYRVIKIIGLNKFNVYIVLKYIYLFITLPYLCFINDKSF